MVRFRRVLCILAFGFVSSVFLAHTAQAGPILETDGDGVLTGAKGVEVQGELYDVEFLTGRCLDIFECSWEPGESPTSVNFFEDRFVLIDALYALYDQVFIDGLLGNFGSDGSLINGCQNTPTGTCIVQSPISFFLFQNPDPDFFMHLIDVPEPGGGATRPDEPAAEYVWAASTDFSLSGQRTWARWSDHVADPISVPTPDSLLLFGIGLLGLLAARRRFI